MENLPLDDLIKRYESGDRNPELIRALNEAAWEGFHDPWEPPEGAGEEGEAERDLDTVLPFTTGTIERHLKARGFAYYQQGATDFLVLFGYDKPSDRSIQVMHSVQGTDGTTYRLRIAGDRRVNAGAYPVARELCSVWNDDYRWPRAFLEIPAPDGDTGPPDSGLLVLDYQLPLAKGIHQALFEDLVANAIGASWDFWKLAKENFGL